MGWRERLNLMSGPGVLPGVTFGDWLKLLASNGFRVHPKFVPRAISITWFAALNSPAALVERLRFGRAIQATQVPPPLFIIGHWRSGTTLLHDLMAVDDRFACPNLFQVMYPHTFLTTERVGAALLRMLSPKRRPQDNMKLDPAAAWEDEFALCGAGFTSPCLTWAFPGRAAHYDRFLTFRGATAAETDLWRATVRWLLKKLTLRHGKPLVLKSPTHTCRIKLLLEMFPGARFFHIRRHPYAVFQSSLHLYETILPLIRLQRTDRFDWAGRVIRQYKEMHDAFFEERPLIPAGQFHETSFEDLERDPVGEVGKAYASLGLPDFRHVEADLRRYVGSLSGYRKNAHADLAPEARARVAREWGRSFGAWNYPL